MCRRDKALSTDDATAPPSRRGAHCTPLVKGALARDPPGADSTAPLGSHLRECPRLALMTAHAARGACSLCACRNTARS